MKNLFALSVIAAFACSGVASASTVKIQDLKLDHEQGGVQAMNGNADFIFGHHHHGHHHHHHGHHHGRVTSPTSKAASMPTPKVALN